jgi:hypothetical protein
MGDDASLGEPERWGDRRGDPGEGRASSPASEVGVSFGSGDGGPRGMVVASEAVEQVELPEPDAVVSLEGMIARARQRLRLQLSALDAMVDAKSIAEASVARLGRSLTFAEFWDVDGASSEVERAHLQNLAERIAAQFDDREEDA